MIFSTTRIGGALHPTVIGRTARSVARRLYSDDEDVVLARDLTVPYQAPQAALGITIRLIRQKDIAPILESAEGLSGDERWDVERRRELLVSGIGACYVASDDRDDPCYVQWLFGQHDNPEVQRFFKGWFPPLDRQTALLEAAYTLPAYRGKGIMSAAMARIAERAAEFDARCVITFVGAGNTASLKGCARAGFSICRCRRIEYRFFTRKIVDAKSERRGERPEIDDV
jgi:RimJ/RimL family protein N-acetyltransferase